MCKQLIIICLLIFYLRFTSSELEPEQLHYTGGACSVFDDVKPNTTYTKNIITLISNLTSFSALSKFSNFSVGSGKKRVNGLYLCRPDLPIETCTSCVTSTANVLRTLCTDKKEAIIWYEECMIRYSNRSIFSIEEIQPSRPIKGVYNVSEPDGFPDLLNKTMQRLIEEAVSGGNEIPFGFGDVTFTVFEGLYGMVLCTPDITREECRHCLMTALDLIPICCGGLSQLTTVPLPSCQLRYDTAPLIFPSSPSIN